MLELKLVFHSGGGLRYLLDPGFGYLAGFVPAAWLTGRLSQQNGMGDLLAQTTAAIAGLITLQLCGLINLGIGAMVGRWGTPLPDLIMQYSLGPLPAQLLLCTAIGLLAVLLRRRAGAAAIQPEAERSSGGSAARSASTAVRSTSSSASTIGWRRPSLRE